MLAMITTQTVISKSSANMATAAHTVQVLPTIDLKLIAHHPPDMSNRQKYYALSGSLALICVK